MAEKKAWLHSPGERAEGAVTLFLHVLIHGFLFLPIALYTLSGLSHVVFLLWIIGSHFVIDLRRWVSPKEGWGDSWVWTVDQIMHFAALSLAYPITYALT